MADTKVLGIDSVTGQADYVDAGERALNISNIAGGYLLVDLSADTTTPTMAINNHCPFNRITNSVGTAISLDTASAYSNVNNTASIGRFTIAANTAVSMRGFISTIGYLAGVSYLGFTWYNADTGVAIGIEGGANNGLNTDANVSQMLAIASITTGASPVRVELRLTGLGGPMTQWYSGNTNIPGSWAELSVESSTAPVTPSALIDGLWGTNGTTANVNCTDLVNIAFGSSLLQMYADAGITYNAGTSTWTLPAGKWEMSADLNDGAQATSPIYQFFNVTTNALISSVRGQSAGQAAAFGGEVQALALIKSATAFDVAIRSIGAWTLTCNNFSINSYVRFQQLST